MTEATRAAVEAVWRMEQSRLIAGLARVVHDVGLAKDLAQDALVAALETWPQRGVPDKPGAWLMTTARHRGLDLLRRRAVLERKQAELGRDLEPAHRLVRAKRSGDDWMRPALCADAQRMVRVLVALLPAEPEVAGLKALVLVTRGLAALERAERLAESPGPYALQAAIAACHAPARVGEDTDWTRIAALYAALVRLTPSPASELNRAMSLSMALGPEAGLVVVERLLDESAMMGTTCCLRCTATYWPSSAGPQWPEMPHPRRDADLQRARAPRTQ